MPDYRTIEARTLEQINALGGLIRRRLLPRLKPTEPLPIRQLLRAIAEHGLPTADDEIVRVCAYQARYLPCDSVWAGSFFEDGVVCIQFCPTAWRELDTGDARTRFTAAHELAHCILHLDAFRTHGYVPHAPPEERPEPEWCAEIQANRLAGALLMPHEALASLARRGRLEVGQLVERYGVSEVAAGVRITEVKDASR